VGLLLARQHVQSPASQFLGCQQRRGGWFGVQHGAQVVEQAVEVGRAEGLARHLGNALVVRHHVAAPVGRDGAGMGAREHAAAMPLQRDAGHAARGLDQGRGGIAPAAQRVEDVVKDKGRLRGRGHGRSGL